VRVRRSENVDVPVACFQLTFGVNLRATRLGGRSGGSSCVSKRGGTAGVTRVTSLPF